MATGRLKKYREMRDFQKTREPSGKRRVRSKKPIFVIQEHHASHLHWDFRLEADGVLKSWAVPKGPSMDPSIKRLAVEVEDHPLEYAKFHGVIPAGQYGAGTVKIWDHGTYENVMELKGLPLTLSECIDNGRVEVILHGKRLKGSFALIRTRLQGGKQNWILFKMKQIKMTYAEKVLMREKAKKAA